MEEINWYSKKIGKTVEEFDMFDKYITDVLKEFVKERKEAINYNRCCTQLNGKKIMPFDDWIDLKKYTQLTPNLYKKDLIEIIEGCVINSQVLINENVCFDTLRNELNSEIPEQLDLHVVVSSFSDEQLKEELENRDYHVFIDYPF